MRSPTRRPSRLRARCRHARRSRSRTRPRPRRRSRRRPARRRRAARRPRAAGCSGLSACTSGASGAVAASMPNSGGSGVQSIGISASRIASTVGARRRPAPAPPRRDSAPAVGQHRLILDVGIDAEAVERHVGRGQHRHEPRGAAAPDRRARSARGACGERTTRIHSASAGTRIGTEPVAAGDLGARRRAAAGARRPRHRLRGASIGARRRRRHHRIDDLAVAGAAAQHAAQRILDLGSARAATFVQQFLRRHQHARRADATLRRAMARNDFCSAASVPSESARPSTVSTPARDLAHGDQAGADLPPVEQHRAGAAVARIAADLGAGEPEIVAQRRGQTRDRRAVPAAAWPFRVKRDLHDAKLRAAGGAAASTDRIAPIAALPRTSSIGESGARCAASTRVGEAPVERRAGQRCLQRRQPLRHRRAGAHRDARRRDPAVSISSVAADHGDGDHQIAPCAELEEGAARGVARLRHVHGDQHFAGASTVRRLPVMKARAAAAARRPAGQLDRGIERQQRGTPSAAGEALQRLPAIVPAFWICAAADLARRLLQPVEQRRQLGLDQFRPGRRRAEPPAVGLGMPRSAAMPLISSTFSSIARPTRAG